MFLLINISYCLKKKSVVRCSTNFPVVYFQCCCFSLQNQMLDYSKRSRSGKFRLVTKFKKEKNNKNKETRSNLGLPGTAYLCVPSLFCSLTIHVPNLSTQTTSFPVSLCEYHLLLPLVFTCVCSFNLCQQVSSHDRATYLLSSLLELDTILILNDYSQLETLKKYPTQTGFL